MKINFSASRTALQYPNIPASSDFNSAKEYTENSAPLLPGQLFNSFPVFGNLFSKYDQCKKSFPFFL